MEQLILGVFLVLFFLELGIESFLNERNLKYVWARWQEKKIPDFFQGHIDPAVYEKSVQYTLAKGYFQRWAQPYSALIALFVLFGGLLPFLDRRAQGLAKWLWPLPYASAILFCFGVGLVFSIARLPVDIYSTFGLETRFGFNKTSVKLYIVDRLKGLLLGMAIGVPFLCAVFWLMEKTGHYWWIWVFIFASGFQLLLIVIYPTLIAPLFNKFEPLKAGELRDRILNLAEQVGFKASGIFSMDGSRRSAHSNAYFTGIGKAKRIVLFDTLINQMTIDQGLAVLAHEMGHYKMKHIRRMLVIQLAVLFIGLFILSLLVNYQPFFSVFGFGSSSNHVALVLFTLVSSPFTFYLGPLMNFLSRKHEYEADRFAATALHDGRPMEEALIKLTVENLSNLTPDSWYSAYHYSHPTTAERISAIRQLVPDSDKGI
jgi:STE24 endopeptidase